jgi:hypothetical protein
MPVKKARALRAFFDCPVEKAEEGFRFLAV